MKPECLTSLPVMNWKKIQNIYFQIVWIFKNIFKHFIILIIAVKASKRRKHLVRWEPGGHREPESAPVKKYFWKPQSSDTVYWSLKYCIARQSPTTQLSVLLVLQRYRDATQEPGLGRQRFFIFYFFYVICMGGQKQYTSNSGHTLVAREYVLSHLIYKEIVKLFIT